MVHERFDLAHWQDIFTNDYAADCCRWHSPGEGITGPADICSLEYHRSRIREACDLGRPAPADVFVFALGEPEERSVTKFGGIPYRPAAIPWPREGISDSQCGTILVDADDLEKRLTQEDWEWMRKNGVTVQECIDESFPRLRFLAQFNFADSHDLVGALPGDVLLLFGFYDHPFIQYYEWYPLGVTDLIDPADVPTTGYVDADAEFVTCYGQIYRTCDYPEAERLIPDFHDRLRDCFGNQAIFRLKAHRIGGTPYLIQREPRLSGRLIAVLDGVRAKPDRPWPWLNVEKLPPQPSSRRQRLAYSRSLKTFIDCDASIYLYLDQDGAMHWEDQCT